MRTIGFLMVWIAAAALPSAAVAQCRLCSKPTTAPDQTPDSADVQLEIQTTLDFDQLILAQAGAGDAVLRPDGSTASTGSVQGVAARARVATVMVHGEANRALRIDVPRRIDLFTLGGGRLTFDQVETDAPDLPKLDSAGNLIFHIGGRLRFVGGEDGRYRGDLPVTVEYQ
jgi:hypothetical protein